MPDSAAALTPAAPLRAVALAAALAVLGGCDDQGLTEAETGPTVSTTVAPLSLPGVGHGCYDRDRS